MEQKTYRLNDGREVSLRPLMPSDKEQLIQMYHSMSESALRWTTAPTDEKIDQIIQFPDYYITLVTVNDGRVIGHGEIKKDSEKKNGSLTIHIHQDFHGVGLGTTMMIALMSDAMAHELNEIKLQVAAENRNAVRLFRKFGFQQYRKVNENSINDDVYWMIRKLVS